MEIYTDSDWASDKQTRRSVSCSTIFLGGCLLFSASRTQKLVSLSSAEAEVYACSSGASDGLLLARLVSWMSGFKTTIYLFTDSSGARGILQRQGVGRVRHLSCRILWLQDLICNGSIKLCTIAGAMNPADIGTKRLPASRMRSLMSLLGMYNVATGAVGGAEDPGHLFQKKHHVMTILSVLGLLQMKGCDENESRDLPNASRSIMAFTVMLGFMFLLFWFWLRRDGQANADANVENEPNTEPSAATISDPTVLDETAAGEIPSELARHQRVQPTVDGYLVWLIERCCRRRDNADTVERRLLHEEGPDDNFRAAADRTLGNMSDISDDENSPNYERIHAEHASVDQAMIAYNFVLALHCNQVQHRAQGSVRMLTPCTMPLVLDVLFPMPTLMMMQKAQNPKVRQGPKRMNAI